MGYHTSVGRATLPLQNNKVQNSEKRRGKRCWPHPQVRCLSRGGLGGHCRYPADRVPPHTSSKSRRRAKRALMRVHMSRRSSSRLLAQGSSGAATCPMAPTPAPGSGQLQSCHMSRGLSSHLLAQGSSGTAMYPVAPAPASWLRAASEPPRVP
jgi:hypothetical protein